MALVTIQQLVEQLEPSLLGNKLKLLQSRLTQFMAKHGLASQGVAKRIRIVRADKRLVLAKSFEIVAAAAMRTQSAKKFSGGLWSVISGRPFLSLRQR